jgi:DNA (cytosine-5)-methyltransferase 1
LVNTDSNRREPWCETATLDRYWDTVDAASWAGIGLGNTEYQRRNTNPVGGQIAGITKERWLRELERSSSDIEWLYCRDDKHRPIKRGTPPLVNGLPRGVVPSSYQGMEINADNTAEARIMRLKGYGNAIVPTVAAEFIATFVDYDGYGKLI